MKNGFVRIVAIVALVALTHTKLLAAEQTPAPSQQPPGQQDQKAAEPAEKPLAPGWLALECCVGLADDAIAKGKGVVQDALGIGMSGFFDVRGMARMGG